MATVARGVRMNDLLPLVARAAESGDVEAVLDIADLIRRWKATSPDERPSTGSGLGNDDAILSQPPSKSSRKQAREWANQARANYAAKHGLQRHHLRTYISELGSVLGIAPSRWRSGEPRCFLGMPERPQDPSGNLGKWTWDMVILLCELEGRLLDFVIPMSELEQLWPSFYRSGGDVKFHVQKQSGAVGKYELNVPGDSALDLQEFMGKEIQ